MNNLDVLNQEIPAQSFEMFGQAFFHVWKAALVKGLGKVDFDPTVHKRMVWAIDLSIIPFETSNARSAERSMIQTSNEWKLTQASIREHGIEPSEIDQKFVKVSFKPTGETYISSLGEEKNKTYIHFEKIYASEADCMEDSYFVSDDEVQTTEDAETAVSGHDEKGVATVLLEQMVRAICKNNKGLVAALNALKTKLPESPMVAKYFTTDSPELLAMVQKELAA